MPPLLRLLPCLLTLLQAAPPDLMEQGAPAIRRFTDEHGLPANSVDGLGLDAQGHLWAATQGGPARFDGHAWHTLPTRSGLAGEWIHGLLCEADGSVYFCTTFAGVWHWDGRQVRRLPSDGLEGRQPLQVLRLDGQLHVTTYQGLLRFSGSRWDKVVDLREGVLLAAAVQGEGPGRRLWVATASRGLGCLEQGTWRWFGKAEGLPDLQVRALAVDGPRLWIGTVQGMACLEEGRIRAFPAREGLPSPAVRALQLSRTPQGASVLWIATEGGLARWEGTQRRVWDRSRGLTSTSLSAVAVRTDPGGREIVWVATQEGVVQLTGGTWSSFGQHLRTQDPNTWAILETDQPRATWFASTSLNRWQNGRWSAFGPAEGVPQDICCALAATDGGRTVWLGTRAHGLLRFDGQRFRPVGPLPDPYVYSLLVTRDPDGSEVLWAGHRKGISVLRRGQWRHMGPAQGFPEGLVTGLAAASDGQGGTLVWASVRARGLGCLKPGAQTWTWFDPEQSHPRPTSLRTVRLQGREELWMGTFGGGLRRFQATLPFQDLGTLRSEALGGAPVDITFSVQQDHAGLLYAFTQRGVVRLQPTADGGFLTRHYGREDGLPSVECQHQSSLVDRQGRVWAGTVGGPAAIDPATLPLDQAIPPLHLLSVSLDGQEQRLEGTELPVSWRARRLQVAFRQLAFHRSAETRYQTFLQGVDAGPTEWTPADRREFSRLPSGSHQLWIHAKDYAGTPSPPVQLALAVEAPPWLRPWAFALYVLAGGGALWGFLRWRLARLQAQNRLLAAQVAAATAGLEARARELDEANRRLAHANQHLGDLNEQKNRMLGIAAHDLRSPLGTVDLYAQALEEEPLSPEARPMVEKIRALVRHLVGLVQQILDTSRIDAGTLDLDLRPVDLGALMEELLPAHQPRALAKGQSIRVEAASGLPAVLADPLRLRQVLDNLVGNALKFMPPGPPERTVRIRLGEGLVEIQDEGPGFSAEDQAKVFGHFQRLSARPTGGEASTGLGLSIVRQLVEAMGGTITLASAPGEGARFLIQLPLAREP